jgi:nicotinate-nucleotide adenylyltransferase
LTRGRGTGDQASTLEPLRSRICPGLPPHGPRQRIGLLGGSFNPAHAGHRQISLLALRRLELDAVWWLVTPGNPLKSKSELPPLDRRMADAAEVALHPRIVVSGVEARFGTRYTADLVRKLRVSAPGTRFVWIMGSDNLCQFHRWDRWQAIAATVPIAVVNRPGSLAAAIAAPSAQALARYRIDERHAALLPLLEPPAWTFLTGPRTDLSSTALRAAS